MAVNDACNHSDVTFAANNSLLITGSFFAPFKTVLINWQIQSGNHFLVFLMDPGDTLTYYLCWLMSSLSPHCYWIWVNERCKRANTPPGAWNRYQYSDDWPWGVVTPALCASYKFHSVVSYKLKWNVPLKKAVERSHIIQYLWLVTWWSPEEHFESTGLFFLLYSMRLQ